MTKVVAAILKKKNFFLISSRPKGKMFENYWEFPGGKVEKDESLKQALCRELKEELNIQTHKKDLLFLDSYEYSYSNQIINLNFFLCFKWFGKIQPNDNQELQWIVKKNIINFNLLPSNNKVIKLI